MEPDSRAFWIIGLGIDPALRCAGLHRSRNQRHALQVLYVMFYGALGLFFYMLRYIKQYIAQVKEFLAKQFVHL
jgi:hypothetical protein